MATTVTSSLTNLLDPGLAEAFIDGMVSGVEGLDTLFNVESTDQNTIESMGINPAGAYIGTSEGGTISTRALTEGYKKTYSHTSYSYGLSMSRKAYLTARAKFSILADYYQSMGYSNGQKISELCWSLFTNGFSDTTTADGVTLFNASHPTTASGSVFSNTGSTSFDAAGIEAAHVALETQTTPDGLKMSTNATHVVVPLALRQEAFELLGSVFENSSGPTANGKTVYTNYASIAGVQPLPSKYLTSASNWFLVDAAMTKKAFNCFVLQGFDPEVVERHPDTHNYQVTDLLVGAAGFDSWRGTWGSSI